MGGNSHKFLQKRNEKAITFNSFQDDQRSFFKAYVQPKADQNKVNVNRHRKALNESISPYHKSNPFFYKPTDQLFIQPKLTISPVDDPYEREADMVAEKVVNTPDELFTQPKISAISIQKKCAACEREEEEKVQRKSFQHLTEINDQSSESISVSGIYNTLIQRQKGTSQVEDTVTSHNQDPITHIWSGTVDRREFVPASGSTPERNLGTIRGIRIEFVPTNCSISLPSKLKFEHPNSTYWPHCGEDSGDPIPSPQLDAGDFNATKGRYISLTNQWLNGWYKVRMTNCLGDCIGHEMDINVDVEEDAANADTTVVLANTTGRSCASSSQVTLHTKGLRGGGIMNHRLIHESGHMALGYFDEYPVSQGNPDEESVRSGDFSMAGSSSNFREWMQLYERHFSFVTEFLRTIYPDCQVELIEISRPETNLEFTGNIGGTSYRGGGLYYQLGLDLDIPVSRSRDWQLFLGAHSHLMMPLTNPDLTAFLFGARVGFQHTIGLSTGGFQWGGYGEMGYGTFGGEIPESFESGRYGASYFMVGGSLGYSGGPTSGILPFINLEGGYGSTILRGEDLAIYGNSDWFFLGLNAGLQWR